MEGRKITAIWGYGHDKKRDYDYKHLHAQWVQAGNTNKALHYEPISSRSKERILLMSMLVMNATSLPQPTSSKELNARRLKKFIAWESRDLYVY
ncbi:hypothetical protein RRG08_055309 [Elysia crispata]|uniref:Uncharacterized protein n=1 Tax=Elysia crispata TaxID=231223 RepID=A0AAE1ASN8_9GAST|nr:hypothetical protein RRG08_055309 [Elysia crispata]